MNMIVIDGLIVTDPVSSLIRMGTLEVPLVSFTILDTGMPYQAAEPLSIEVHFTKDVAMSIFPYLKKGKDVIVYGHLKVKDFETGMGGKKRKKYFISAEIIKFSGGVPRGARKLKEKSSEAIDESI